VAMQRDNKVQGKRCKPRLATGMTASGITSKGVLLYGQLGARRVSPLGTVPSHGSLSGVIQTYPIRRHETGRPEPWSIETHRTH
jgi:hypothetical protein